MKKYIKVITWIFKSNQSKETPEVQQIQNLKQQLVHCGYQPEELDYFIMLQFGTADFTKLNDLQANTLVNTLKSWLDMANKFKKII